MTSREILIRLARIVQADRSAQRVTAAIDQAESSLNAIWQVREAAVRSSYEKAGTWNPKAWHGWGSPALNAEVAARRQVVEDALNGWRLPPR